MIGIGGVVLAVIFTNSVVCQECSNDVDRSTSHQMTSQGTRSSKPGQSYGSVSSGQSSQ
jgi:hypothetical protein